MARTERKIGQLGAKKGIPVREGKGYAEHHGIEVPHDCRCEYCMSEVKRKKAKKLAEKEMNQEWWMLLEDESPESNQI
jgi:hypothetical protein